MSRHLRLRLGILFFIVCLFFIAVVARLFHLQVLNHARYADIVARQSNKQVEIPAARGLIYDRQGKVVVDNIVRWSLYAYPTSQRDIANVTNYLKGLPGWPSGSGDNPYKLRVGRFRWIQRQMPDDLAAQVHRDAPRGLYLRQEKQRSYPYGLVGKQVLGFTDIDNCGQSGIELTYDSVLAGRPGEADMRRDGLARTYAVDEKALIEPHPGRSVVLTFDWSLQEIVEEELRRAVTKHNAKSAQAVFIDCNNGDVLAAAHYDPSEPHPDKPSKLRPVCDQFEPGSIFKVVTAAGLLDAGLIDFDDSVHCEGGAWRVGRRVLHDDKEHEWLNFRRVIELSSNIGTAKYAISLGGESLWETARRFGIGQKLRTGLPCEARGQMYQPNRWSDYTISALAMGHGVAVTALQMATVFGAVANGGDLLRPSLVYGLVDDDNIVVETRRYERLARAMSQTTADSLTDILHGVVDSGTATPVKSEVLSIAGKTGTAQIPDLENHTYFRNRYVGSFAGFFPVERPLMAGIVLLEEPHPVHYGGWTAGPAFRRIAERYAALHPDLFATPDQMLSEHDPGFGQTVELPVLLGHRIDRARATLDELGLALRSNADSGTVLWQYPGPDQLVTLDQPVLVTVDAPDAAAKMFNLKGLSIRQAAAAIDHLGLRARIEGHGVVVSQSVKAGRKIKPGDLCVVKCRPL